MTGDSDGLLHGTGSRVRHPKIKQLGDLKTTAARKILMRREKVPLVLREDGAGNHDG